MKTTAGLAIAVVALITASAHAVTIEWVMVGNPGNANDETGLGGVDYSYWIGKYEVTNAQYAEFLNAVDPTGTDSHFLYNSQMAGPYGGIANTGPVDGARYVALAGREQKPVTFVTIGRAMQFTNWLHNGQGSGDTEAGAYTITTTSGSDAVHSAGARYWIPSEDEWYKAAYYHPGGVYYDYPTGADAVPYSDNPASLNTPDDTNVANFFKDDSAANGYDDGYAVSGSPSAPFGANPLTDVGAYSLATSPYGTFDQGGNVGEWNEAIIEFAGSTYRGVRGGAWNVDSSFMRGDEPQLSFEFASLANPSVGFRVATIPEPGTVFMGVLAAGGWLVRRRR